MAANEDEPAPEPEAEGGDGERFFKCVTFFKSVRADGALNYYAVDVGHPCQHVKWMWAPRYSQQEQLLGQAFNEGRPARISWGKPYAKPGFGYVARAFKVQLEYEPPGD